MKKVLVTFGDNKFKGALQLLKESALKNGIDEVKIYTKKELQKTNFWKKNSYILNKSRGAGYWIWKPYIILDTLKELNNNDIVMYSDAAVEIISSLNPLFNIANQEDYLIFRLAGHHKNKTWTKRDTFILMNCDEQKYWNANQTTASYHLWKKTDKNINFLKEYQKYLRDPRIVTDEPNMMGYANFIEFKDHRHDQSVLSLMSIKYNMIRYRDISQYGNTEIKEFNNSNYPQIVNHHRQRF